MAHVFSRVALRSSSFMDTATDSYSKRRNRMRRTSAGKRIEISPRDLDIFALLTRYRFLRSTFIHAFVGGDRTQLMKRLGTLFHEGYLDRPPQQWQSVNARYQPAVYAVTDRAEALLQAHGRIEPMASALLVRGRSGAQRQFAHSLMICDILSSIELGTLQAPGLRFIPLSEILSKAPEATRLADNPLSIPVAISHTFANAGRTVRATTKLVPDGLFGLQYGTGDRKTYRFFALEADRASMPILRNNLHQSSYLKKVLGYRQIAAQNIHKGHLGLPNLFVLNVTTSTAHMQGIMRLVEQIAGSSSLFLFKTMDSLASIGRAPTPTPHMLTQPWQRASLEPFSIDR